VHAKHVFFLLFIPNIKSWFAGEQTAFAAAELRQQQQHC
jgi:hypothetical protein